MGVEGMRGLRVRGYEGQRTGYEGNKGMSGDGMRVGGVRV